MITLLRLLSCVVLVGGWELVTARGWVDAALLPPPAQIGVYLLGLAHDAPFLRAARITLTEFALAFLLAVVCGTVAGLAIGRSRRLYALCNPVVSLFYSFPKMVLLPVFLLVFGVGVGEKVVFGFFHGVWVMIVNICAGLESVDPNLERSAHAMGASRWQLWRTLYIPTITPLFFVGLRSAVVFTFLGVIIAEMTVSRFGLGQLLLTAIDTANLAYIFAIVLLITLLSVAFNSGLDWYQGRLFRWKTR